MIETGVRNYRYVLCHGSQSTAMLCAGFTIVDCLALGSFGHAIGAGIILGLKNTGQL